ncbi:MAG: RagB/SusD family nutrient uptake outer membrane protein [Bacteroidota bacterium]
MKNKLLVIGMLFSLTTLVSCKKFLDKEPLSAGTDGNFWKNEDEANGAVAGGYALLRQSLTDAFAFYSYGDIPTDEFTTSIGYEDLTQVTNFQWNLSVSSSNVWRPMLKLRRYDNFYRVIDQASRCIKFIPTVPASGFASPATAETNRNSFIGEAYFLRAFTYFYMARVWGGVPIIEQTADKIGDEVNLARSTEEEVLAKAKADVMEAISKLSFGYTNSSNRAVRANKGAAYALLAHIEAWSGNYEEAAAAASQVIENGGYQFVPMQNYLSIFKGQSAESIFEISANATNEGSGFSIANLTLKAPYLATNPGTGVPAPLNINSFKTKFPDSSDLRIKYGFTGYNSTDPNVIKYSNIIYLTTDADGNKGNPLSQNNIVIFRLSDIVLLKAEALAATGKYGEARILLDQIRTKAQPGNTYTGGDADLFDAVIEERSRELFLEGHRFYDLVRLGRARGVYDFGDDRMDEAAFKAGKFFWPIDPSLMTLNNKLIQTPYWRDKM